DGPSTQEADAGDHATHNARRVIKRAEAVDGGDGEHGRANADQAVGTDARWFSSKLALEADQSGDDPGEDDPNERSDLRVLEQGVDVRGHYKRSLHDWRTFINS